MCRRAMSPRRDGFMGNGDPWRTWHQRCGSRAASTRQSTAMRPQPGNAHHKRQNLPRRLRSWRSKLCGCNGYFAPMIGLSGHFLEENGRSLTRPARR